ncbi:MAG: GHKL domain-containing protein [Bacteroidales bacterium]|nr:GHKL domain-containing protein [Bacteroidales bacterium]
MSPELQAISDLIQNAASLSGVEKESIYDSIRKVEKELEIVKFKLDRTEKVKRTTAILLEETIEELEQKRKAIEETNDALTKSLEELRAAQEQLVQQEKLASLGQLTAGIAHEIKNPLNFVNNFSELSIELIDEVFEELGHLEKNETTGLITEILNDIKGNLQKVHEHGTRADGIVKSMLMHSRGSSGKKVSVDFNSLIRENVNLTFHSMRANKNPINAEINFNLDESLGEVPLITEDFSRVIVNLCSNAFDAMRESCHHSGDYKPKLTITGKKQGQTAVVEIHDNGPGIPDEIRDKILQPFFTTKKGTEGTGLGLSISHDIVNAHGGVLTLDSNVGEGTTFHIQIPLKT